MEHHQHLSTCCILLKCLQSTPLLFVSSSFRPILRLKAMLVGPGGANIFSKPASSHGAFDVPSRGWIHRESEQET